MKKVFIPNKGEILRQSHGAKEAIKDKLIAMGKSTPKVKNTYHAIKKLL